MPHFSLYTYHPFSTTLKKYSNAKAFQNFAQSYLFLTLNLGEKMSALDGQNGRETPAVDR